jgi:hypothetical protein
MKYDKRPVRFAYDGSGNIEYVGVNTIDGVDGSILTWQISKVVYDTGNIDYIEGPIVGEWDEKTSLPWT